MTKETKTREISLYYLELTPQGVEFKKESYSCIDDSTEPHIDVIDVEWDHETKNIGLRRDAVNNPYVTEFAPGVIRSSVWVYNPNEEGIEKILAGHLRDYVDQNLTGYEQMERTLRRAWKKNKTRFLKADY